MDPSRVVRLEPDRGRGIAHVVGSMLVLGLTVVLALTLVTVMTPLVSPPEPVHAVDWELRIDEEAGTASVRHGGGPAVDGSSLILSGSLLEGEVALSEIGPDRWVETTDAATTINVSAPGMVRLEWIPFVDTRLPLAVATTSVSAADETAPPRRNPLYSRSPTVPT